MNVDLAMPILCRIFFSHLLSDANRLARYMNLLTWSRRFPCTVIFQAGMIVELENTMLKDFTSSNTSL